MAEAIITWYVKRREKEDEIAATIRWIYQQVKGQGRATRKRLLDGIKKKDPEKMGNTDKDECTRNRNRIDGRKLC